MHVNEGGVGDGNVDNHVNQHGDGNHHTTSHTTNHVTTNIHIHIHASDATVRHKIARSISALFGSRSIEIEGAARLPDQELQGLIVRATENGRSDCLVDSRDL